MTQNRKLKMMKKDAKTSTKLEAKLVIKSYANLGEKFDTKSDV